MAYDLRTGTERWHLGGLPRCGASTPVVGGGVLYLSASGVILDPVYIKENPEKAAAFYATNETAMVAISPGGSSDSFAPKVAWREPKGVPGIPSPLYFRGRLYLVKNGGILFCRDAHTGKLVFRGRLGAGGEYYSSPVAGDGKVFIASYPGVITVVEAGNQLNVLSRNDLTETITATPAIVGNELYVRTERQLFAFSLQGDVRR